MSAAITTLPNAVHSNSMSLYQLAALIGVCRGTIEKAAPGQGRFFRLRVQERFGKDLLDWCFDNFGFCILSTSFTQPVAHIEFGQAVGRELIDFNVNVVDLTSVDFSLWEIWWAKKWFK